MQDIVVYSLVSNSRGPRTAGVRAKYRGLRVRGPKMNSRGPSFTALLPWICIAGLADPAVLTKYRGLKSYLFITLLLDGVHVQHVQKLEISIHFKRLSK